MEHGDNIIRVDHVFSGLTLSQGIGLVFPPSPTPFADNNNMTIADRKHTRKLRYISNVILPNYQKTGIPIISFPQNIPS